MATRIQADMDLRIDETGRILGSRGTKLAALLSDISPVQSSGNTEIEVVALAYNSRQVTPASAFFAIRGEKTDGNLFVFDAIERGASAIVSEMPRPWDASWSDVFERAGKAPERHAVPSEIAWIQVRDARKALAAASANFYHRPADALNLVGVTGTNGKTTTSYLVDSILRAAGRTTGLFGTIAYRTPRASSAASTTTPESLDLQRFLGEVRDAGGSAAVMEASSHALAMDRLWGLHFAVAIFTNLTRDHLDYHKTFDDYFAAKQRLFEGTGANRADVGVVNSDDPYGKKLLGAAARTLTYGLTNGAQIIARSYELGFHGLHFIAQTPAGKIEIRSPLVGRINIYNILAAIGAGLALEISLDVIADGIAKVANVPGRFERVDCGQPFLVIVDYAHTDDALRNLLATAKELGRGGRIITLFGCGGDRDRAKRPMMGEAAGRASDFVVLTSDNPRSEDPLLIMNDAMVGLQRTRTPYRVESDREKAVAIALDEARAGDIVLLAGKGHETSQVLKDRTLDFDDREVARRLLHDRGYTAESK
jgi:UDP-N-acetylmuramoyl-L-alanyl-D-glutamate--2,6-diaminopimelate ligase